MDHISKNGRLCICDALFDRKDLLRRFAVVTQISTGITFVQRLFRIFAVDYTFVRADSEEAGKDETVAFFTPSLTSIGERIRSRMSLLIAFVVPEKMRCGNTRLFSLLLLRSCWSCPAFPWDFGDFFRWNTQKGCCHLSCRPSWRTMPQTETESQKETQIQHS